MSIKADLRAAAARNNAGWCHAMARAHGAVGTFAAAAWINLRPAPPFYPNLVTLGAPDDGGAHLAAIRQLTAAPPAQNWAAKDSFATLDLTPLGFRLLFEASWIYRPARAAGSNFADCRVHRVTSGDALAAWELAWRGSAMESSERLFPPELLAERDHAIVAVTHDGAIIAGCIASRSDGVRGISNLFAPAGDDGSVRAACLAAAADVSPGLPLVGYESGDDLARMKALGFTEIGPLRVWQAGS